ncbi:Pyrophosphate--fructose 6-phosphate 1-phosphotransferase subunit beta 1 [Glycine soja]
MLGLNKFWAFGGNVVSHYMKVAGIEGPKSLGLHTLYDCRACTIYDAMFYGNWIKCVVFGQSFWSESGHRVEGKKLVNTKGMLRAAGILEHHSKGILDSDKPRKLLEDFRIGKLITGLNKFWAFGGNVVSHYMKVAGIEGPKSLGLHTLYDCRACTIYDAMFYGNWIKCVDLGKVFGQNRVFDELMYGINLAKGILEHHSKGILDSDKPRKLLEDFRIGKLITGNIHRLQVGKIEAEKMLIQMVETELEKRKQWGTYKGGFRGQSHFFGYSVYFRYIILRVVREMWPTNFDSTYCYALGYGAATILQSGKTGLISSVGNLCAPVEEWTVGGTALSSLMDVERRHGMHQRIPIWYDVKLLTVAWLVLPQFAGAAYLYERFVREHIRKYITERQHLYGNHQQQSKKSPNNDGKAKKFFEFVTPKKKSDVAFVDPSHVIV